VTTCLDSQLCLEVRTEHRETAAGRIAYLGQEGRLVFLPRELRVDELSAGFAFG
jgi:hypothetical protein